MNWISEKIAATAGSVLLNPKMFQGSFLLHVFGFPPTAISVVHIMQTWCENGSEEDTTGKPEACLISDVKASTVMIMVPTTTLKMDGLRSDQNDIKQPFGSIWYVVRFWLNFHRLLEVQKCSKHLLPPFRWNVAIFFSAAFSAFKV